MAAPRDGFDDRARCSLSTQQAAGRRWVRFQNRNKQSCSREIFSESCPPVKSVDGTEGRVPSSRGLCTCTSPSRSNRSIAPRPTCIMAKYSLPLIRIDDLNLFGNRTQLASNLGGRAVQQGSRWAGCHTRVLLTCEHRFRATRYRCAPPSSPLAAPRSCCTSAATRAAGRAFVWWYESTT